MNWLAGSLLYVLVSNSLVHFEPGDVPFWVFILQPEVPGFTEADCPANEVKELLAGGFPPEAELQFGVHGRNFNRKWFSGRFLSLEHFDAILCHLFKTIFESTLTWKAAITVFIVKGSFHWRKGTKDHLNQRFVIKIEHIFRFFRAGFRIWKINERPLKIILK